MLDFFYRIQIQQQEDETIYGLFIVYHLIWHSNLKHVLRPLGRAVNETIKTNLHLSPTPHLWCPMLQFLSNTFLYDWTDILRVRTISLQMFKMVLIVVNILCFIQICCRSPWALFLCEVVHQYRSGVVIYNVFIKYLLLFHERFRMRQISRSHYNFSYPLL